MLTGLFLMAVMAGMVRGHGMMIDPPQRSSMWRYGYSTPRNYDDNQLYCGGFSRQWNINGGKCGVCGDPYDDSQPRANEAGGMFATGVIVKTYRQGQAIDVSVKITANHMGYFVFKLCPNNNVKKVTTQECLDQHVLTVLGPDGEDMGTQFYIDNKVDTKSVRLQLPSDVACSQCVLQWTYNTGNSWGCENVPTRRCCIGCGHQENFVNCADIAISADDTNRPTNRPTNKPKVTDSPVVPPVPQKTTPSGSIIGTGKRCIAVGIFTGSSDMIRWCSINCSRGYCPQAYCSCF
ncbi:hypothetical protein ACOMHN_025448 [Nucella lapillus]